MAKNKPSYVYVAYGYLTFFVLLAVFIFYCLSSRGQEVDNRYVDVKNPTYSVLYDAEYQCPVFVSWSVTRADVGGQDRRSKRYFKIDTRLPLPRAKDADYTNTGWQRGHMVPAKDRSSSKAAFNSTFLMSNVAPMEPYLNQADWLLSEVATRYLATKYSKVHVVAGALFLDSLPAIVGESRIRVPSHYWKAIYTTEVDTLVNLYLFSNDAQILGLPARRVRLWPPLPAEVKNKLPKFLQGDSIRYKQFK